MREDASMTQRIRPKTIYQASDARSAPVGSTAELDGIRFKKVGDDTWSAAGERDRGDDEMLRGRLWVVKP